MRLGVRFEQLDGVIKALSARRIRREGREVFVRSNGLERCATGFYLTIRSNNSQGESVKDTNARLKFYFCTVITSLYRVCTAARVLRGKRQHGNCRTFRHALSLYLREISSGPVFPEPLQI